MVLKTRGVIVYCNVTMTYLSVQNNETMRLDITVNVRYCCRLVDEEYVQCSVR